MSKAEIVASHRADENNVVLTIHGGKGVFRAEPCPECPWRKSNVGSFPAEAFRHSARTATDMSERTFGCHMSTPEHPSICAGFLCSTSADHNLSIRMAVVTEKFSWDDVSDAGAELFGNYTEMAVANGVDPTDPCLEDLR